MFTDTDKKLLAGRCKQLLVEYESIIKAIIDDEVQQMNSGNSVKGTIEDIAKDAIFKEGKKEGMRTLLDKIYRYAGRNAPQQESNRNGLRDQ
jgi:hypothetical protein